MNEEPVAVISGSPSDDGTIWAIVCYACKAVVSEETLNPRELDEQLLSHRKSHESKNNSRVDLALDIAKRAHKGQVDQLGEDYIKHPMRVHRNLLTHPTFKDLDLQTREDLQVAALLHDVLEDSGTAPGSERFTKEDLLALGFTPRSIELLDLMTRKTHIPADEYYADINEVELARLVKWSDIADNRNVERVAKLEPEKAARLKEKYEHALDIVVMSEADKTWLHDATRLPVEIEWELANESAEAESDLAGYSEAYAETDPEPESSWDEEEG